MKQIGKNITFNTNSSIEMDENGGKWMKNMVSRQVFWIEKRGFPKHMKERVLSVGKTSYPLPRFLVFKEKGCYLCNVKDNGKRNFFNKK